VHNQVMPNVSKLEKPSSHQGIQIDGFTEEQVKGLEAKGHKIEWINSTCYGLLGDGSEY
jgi:gamma-glutamyltranspeptidase/glutathione hydrolase